MTQLSNINTKQTVLYNTNSVSNKGSEDFLKLLKESPERLDNVIDDTQNAFVQDGEEKLIKSGNQILGQDFLLSQNINQTEPVLPINQEFDLNRVQHVYKDIQQSLDINNNNDNLIKENVTNLIEENLPINLNNTQVEYLDLVSDLPESVNDIILTLNAIEQPSVINVNKHGTEIIFDFTSIAIGKLSYKSDGKYQDNIKGLNQDNTKVKTNKLTFEFKGVTPVSHISGITSTSESLLIAKESIAYRIMPSVKYLEQKKLSVNSLLPNNVTHELLKRSVIVTSKGTELGVIIRDYHLNENQIADVMNDMDLLFKQIGAKVFKYIINGEIYNRG